MNYGDQQQQQFMAHRIGQGQRIIQYGAGRGVQQNMIAPNGMPQPTANASGTNGAGAMPPNMTLQQMNPQQQQQHLQHQQMLQQQHQQQLAQQYGGGRGVQQPRGFPMNTPHGMPQPTTIASGTNGSGAMPPNMTLQQMNTQQQQQHLQHQQMLQQQHQQQLAQQQQIQYGGGRGVQQPRGFPMNTPHGMPQPTTNAGGNNGARVLPPTMTLQQMNPQQQQQFLQQQQQLQHQHMLHQQQLAQQNGHIIQQNSPITVHPASASQVQPQLQQQIHSGTPQPAPTITQHLGSRPSSHHSASQQSSPMPPHSIGVHQQPHSIGPGSQQPSNVHSNIAQGGPSSVPSHLQHKQQFTGSPLPHTHGGPPSVSNARPTTPSVRSVSSIGGPSSIGAGVPAASGSTITAAPVPIDQSAPEYRAALEQLKSYGKDCQRLLVRMRIDGSDKLVQSVERVIEIIEGRRVVDLKLLRRLIQNVCSALGNTNPTKGIRELADKLIGMNLINSVTDVLPDVWADVRHLEIGVSDSLEALIKQKEEEMVAENRTFRETGIINRKRKADEMENRSSSPPRNLLMAFAASLNSSERPSDSTMYRIVSTDGPVPVRVECVNERYLTLNPQISLELASLRFNYRFDPDYKPISEHSPHVQIIVGFRSNANVMASSWILPLRLIIPVDYPESNVQIYEERKDKIAKTSETRNQLELKRRQMQQSLAMRGDAIMTELKARLEKKNENSSIKSTGDSASNTTIKTSTSASINEVVNTWSEIAERCLLSTKTSNSGIRATTLRAQQVK